MNKLQTTTRKIVLKSVAKALTLCGVAVTFAACYGTPPHEPTAPEYWAAKNSAEEAIFGAENQQYATREICAETTAEQASRNEQSAPLPGE